MEQSIKIRADEAAAVFGAGDCHLKKIEAVRLFQTGGFLSAVGDMRRINCGFIKN